MGMKPVKNTSDMTKSEISFWQRYCEGLIDLGHTGKEGSYLTKWAQQFVYSLEGVRLKAVTQELIRCWIEELDRKGDLELWQLRHGSINGARADYPKLRLVEFCGG